jgi:phosphoglycerol transferase
LRKWKKLPGEARPVKRARKRPLNLAPLADLAVFLGIGLVAWLGLGFDARNLRVPFAYYRDSQHHAVVARSLVESGQWTHIPRLGFPYGLDLSLFPVGGTLDYSLMRVLALFTGSFGAVLNSFWVLSMMLAGAICAWCLRRLGAARGPSLALGVAYAFAPHVFSRNIEFLMLVHYLVPFAATAAILGLRGQLLALRRRDQAILALGCVGLGLNYAYTAFFACYTLFAAALLRSLLRRAVDREARVLLGAVAVVAATTLANVYPALSGWARDPVARQNMDQKRAAEADVHGLKLRHLLMPVPGHPIPALNELALKAERAGFPLDYENTMERLGLLGSLGLLYLLYLCVAMGAGAGPRAGLAAAVRAGSREAAALALAVFLLATIGGLGSIYNLVISTDIRSYNRAAVFLAFLSLVPASALLTELDARLARRRAAFLAGLAALAGLATLDQVNFEGIRSFHAYSQQRYADLEEFVPRVEAMLPKGAAVYQLPSIEYPHTPPIQRMEPHDHVGGYVFSRELRWSWAALSGPAITLRKELEGLGVPRLVPRLRELGYAAVWIDRRAYADNGEAIIREMSAAAGGALLQSRDLRYAVIALPKG